MDVQANEKSGSMQGCREGKTCGRWRWKEGHGVGNVVDTIGHGVGNGVDRERADIVVDGVYEMPVTSLHPTQTMTRNQPNQQPEHYINYNRNANRQLQ